MRLGRIVIVDTDWQTVAEVRDFLEVKLGTAQAGYLLQAKVMQSTLEGTTSIPKHRIHVKRGTGSFTSGSGGSTAVVVKGQSGDPAHGLATIERNNTTQASAGSGTLEVIDPDVFNESGGVLELTYTPELSAPVGPSEAIILSVDNEAPASGSYRATLKFLITHG